MFWRLLYVLFLVNGSQTKRAPDLNYHLFILAESQEAENPSDDRENHL